MKIIQSLVVASLLTSSVMALEPMQKEAGWSGYAVLGAGTITYKNNEVAGNTFIDVENKSINNLGRPESQTAATPVITGRIRYTLDDKKTEFFLGNSLEDYLRMDMTLTAGVRHDFDDLGIMGVRLLASATPTEVWQDPLLRYVNREKTDRTSSGVAFKWEDMFNSGFEVDFRARRIKFDNDSNGYSMVGGVLGNGAAGTVADPVNGAYYITPGQVSSLERAGTMASLEVLYNWQLNDSNTIVPSIKFENNDRDGDVRDYKEMSAQLTYVYHTSDWLISAIVEGGKADYDTTNPVFREEQDTNFASIGMTATYKNMFGWKGWGLNANVFSSRSDSDVDFYDSEMFMATAGVMYSF